MRTWYTALSSSPCPRCLMYTPRWGARSNIRKGPLAGVLQRRSCVYRGGAMHPPASGRRRIPLPRTWVNKGEEKGRGCQQVRSPRAPEARLARLVPGERAVHPLRRGRRWEFAGSGRGEGLEEVADQPLGALGCVFGGGGDDPGVGHQQQRDVFGHEVLAEASGGLGPLDQLRDSVVDAVPLRPEFAGVGEGLGQDVAESAITLLHAGDGGEVVAEASPGIWAFQRAVERFGVGGELGAEGRDQQVLPGRKAAVQRRLPDPRALGEHVARGGNDSLPVAFRVGPQGSRARLMRGLWSSCHRQ